MGAVTTHKPLYETIDVPLDTTMFEADRVELSKACAELATANNTIKNLSEVVVNFSHTGSILNLQQEKTTTQQPAPKLPPPQLTQHPHIGSNLPIQQSSNQHGMQD